MKYILILTMIIGIAHADGYIDELPRGGDIIVNNIDDRDTTINERDRSQALGAALVEYAPSAAGKTRFDGAIAQHRDVVAGGVTMTHALTDTTFLGVGAAKADGDDNWLFRGNVGIEF